MSHKSASSTAVGTIGIDLGKFDQLRAGLSSARARQSIDSAAHQPPFRRRKRRRGVAARGAK
jgi:hypothetical protein